MSRKAQEKKSVERLEHSNTEIKAFLEIEDDPDLRTAISENLEILDRKRLRLEKIAEPGSTLKNCIVRQGEDIGAHPTTASGCAGLCCHCRCSTCRERGRMRALRE